MRKLKIVCVCLIAFAVAAVALLNVLYPDRPTVSERENRELAKFPEFSISSLLDGSFFSGIDTFVSDNFIGREFLVDVAQRIDTLQGLSSFIPSDDEDVVFIPSKTGQTTSQTDPDDDNNDDSSGNEHSTMSDEGSDDPEEPADQPTETSDETVDNTGKKNTVISYNPIVQGPPRSRGDMAEPAPPKKEDPEQESPSQEEPAQEGTVSEGSSSQEEQTQQTTVETPAAEEKPSHEAAPSPETPAPGTQNTETNTVNNNTDSEKAEFLSDGYIIYKNAVFSIPYLRKSVAENYGKTLDHYAELFKDSQITILVAPLSSGMIDNEKLKKKITDQNSMIETINSYCGDRINKVNVFPTLYEHRDEYIYYRSDHHWTARGAYYAYAEFAKSVGLEPTPLDQMEEKLLNSKFRGTAYSMTGDERVRSFSDELYAYMPTKSNTMTIYGSDGSVTKYKSCVRTGYKGYSAFIDGDNPYTIIDVPDNPAGMTCLVIKDSYGCAFVPFLCENYRTIIVADPRHIQFDLYELLKDYKIRDIIFMTNIYNPNVKSWVRNVNRIVGN